MAPSRSLSVATALALLLPGALDGQDVSSMLARVQTDGRPTAEVSFHVYAGGSVRRLAITGSSGLAVIEFERARLGPGTRVSVFAVTCDERNQILFSRSAASLPEPGETCRRERLGEVVWYRTDRLEVVLGESPRMTGRTASSVVRAQSGVRYQAGPVVAFAAGDELANISTGIGAEVLVGYDALSGLGVGLGVALARHGLEGVDENMWRWAVTAEPRYTFNRPDWTARPYIVVRAAWQSLDSDTGSGLATEKGWSFGGGAGVAFPLWFGLSADVSAHAARLMLDVDGFNDADRSGMLFDVGAAIRF